MKHLLFEGPLDGTVIEDDSLGFPGFITAKVGGNGVGSTYMFTTEHDGHLSTEDHRVYVFLPASREWYGGKVSDTSGWEAAE